MLLSKKLLFTSVLIIGFIGIFQTAQADDCYYLHDKNGKTLYEGESPPFDISAPPKSSEYIASERRGEKLIIAYCPSKVRYVGTENENDQVRNSGNRGVVVGSEYEKEMEKRNLIVGKKIAVGMDSQDAARSWGEPTRINKSVGSYGVNEQWVYDTNGDGIGDQYVYINNGKVSGAQSNTSSKR